MSDISIKLKNIRESKGLTQRELAELIGVAPGYIGNIEARKSNASVKMIRKIAECLNVNPGYFLNEGIDEFDFRVLDHLSLKDKEFIANEANTEWIEVSRQLSELRVKPKTVLEVIKFAVKIKE